jgi:hypothetical protein
MVAKKNGSGRNSSELGGKKRRLTGKQPRSQADDNGNDEDDEDEICLAATHSIWHRAF